MTGPDHGRERDEGRRSHRPAAATTRPPRHAWLALGLVLLGCGAAAVALLGPLIAGVIEYHVSDGARYQIVGGDVAGLVLVAPASLVAAFLLVRRHRAGPVLALGPSAYAVYMYSQLALGGDVTRYPGNSERFFPLFLGLFVLGGAIAVRAWNVTEARQLRSIPGRIARALATYLLVVASFLTFGLHLPGLVDAWRPEPTSAEYLADPVVFWLVKLMDLGIVVPAMVAVAVGLYRRSAWADTAGFMAAGWAALLGSSVAGMAVVMQINDDPAASWVNTAAFGAFALIGLVAAWLVYAPLFGHEQVDHIPGRLHQFDIEI